MTGAGGRSEPGQWSSPYDAGAPVGRPAAHTVVVRPGAVHIAIQIAATLICLGGGLGVLIGAIVGGEMDHRAAALVIGSIFTLIGLGLCATLVTVLRRRTFTFTAEAFEGTFHGRPLRVPWSTVAEVKIRARLSGPTGTTFLLRPRWMPYAFLHFQLREGGTIDGVVGNVLALPFWNRTELIHSFAYGCRTFAEARFTGVEEL